MTQSALAKELGITKQAVQKLAKRGMPTTSPELARAWRARNTRSQVSPPRPPTPESILDSLDDAEAGAEDADGIRDYPPARMIMRENGELFSSLSLNVERRQRASSAGSGRKTGKRSRLMRRARRSGEFSGR